MSIKTVAPTLEKHITEATLIADLTKSAPVAKTTPQKTKEKVETAYARFKEGGVGDTAIAQEVSLTTKQVKGLRKEFQAAKAEVNKEEV